MSCYTRHLGDLLPADPTPQDKRALDRAIRTELRMPDPDVDCPDVWAAVKARRSADPGWGPAVVGGDR